MDGVRKFPLFASKATVLFFGVWTIPGWDGWGIEVRPNRTVATTAKAMLDTITIASGRMSKLMANFRRARGETPDPEMDKMSVNARRLLRLAGFLTWSL